MLKNNYLNDGFIFLDDHGYIALSHAWYWVYFFYSQNFTHQKIHVIPYDVISLVAQVVLASQCNISFCP